jgi:hypothetical protein
MSDSSSRPRLASRLAALRIRFARLHCQFVSSSAFYSILILWSDNYWFSTWCIYNQGRPFAWQESQLVLASVIQNFDLFFADASYRLELKQSLTIKPKGLKIRAVLRSGRKGGIRTRIAPAPALSPTVGVPGDSGTVAAGAESTVKGDRALPGNKVHVLYGSNTGTSETFAQRLATAASQHGKFIGH